MRVCLFLVLLLTLSVRLISETMDLGYVDLNSPPFISYSFRTLSGLKLVSGEIVGVVTRDSASDIFTYEIISPKKIKLSVEKGKAFLRSSNGNVVAIPYDRALGIASVAVIPDLRTFIGANEGVRAGVGIEAGSIAFTSSDGKKTGTVVFERSTKKLRSISYFDESGLLAIYEYVMRAEGKVYFPASVKKKVRKEAGSYLESVTFFENPILAGNP